MNITPSFWKKKRVLVTGHTGFKGSWLTLWLHSLGADVYGLALSPNTSLNAFQALNLESVCRHKILDIRSREDLARAVKEIDPEIVFHMAAQPLVRDSYSMPIETYETNVMGTAHLLYSLSTAKSVRSVVVITTDKCYENREWMWPYRETDALGGYDPYSSSKACAEIVTASFRRSFFANSKAGIATVRAGNVIGGGDWSRDRLIPDIVRAIQANTTLEIRNPDSIRPWQHVLAPLNGYITLAEKLWDEPAQYSQPFNFAPADDDCVPVRVLLDYFGSAWGAPIKWSGGGDSSQKRHEANLLKLDASKAKQVLGWKPQWNLPAALKATASWYRCYYDNPTDIKQFTLKQIDEYYLGPGAHGA